MEQIQWFNHKLLDTNEIQCVLEFLLDLPKNFSVLIDEKNSNFYSEIIRDSGLSSLFSYSYKEVTIELLTEINSYKREAQIDKVIGNRQSSERKLAESLLATGFTGSSLKLKARILQDLWNVVWGKIVSLSEKVIDYTNSDLVNSIMRFTSFLNSILGSLSKSFIAVDGFKEFKDGYESLLKN